MPGDTEQSSDGVRVNRAKLGSISVYEITEDELDLLERGSPNSTYFNFAIALLSVSASFFISIFSTDIADIRVFVIFWVVALLSLAVGAVLLVVWWRASRGVKNIFKRIQNRMVPPATVVENTVVQDEGSAEVTPEEKSPAA